MRTQAMWDTSYHLWIQNTGDQIETENGSGAYSPDPQPEVWPSLGQNQCPIWPEAQLADHPDSDTQPVGTRCRVHPKVLPQQGSKSVACPTTENNLWCYRSRKHGHRYLPVVEHIL